MVIGSSRYADPQIPDEPTVETSAKALTQLLAADPLWAAGVRGPLIDPGGPHDVMDAVTRAAAEVPENGTLLVYFIGHAEFWRDSTTSDLYLTVGNSRRGAEWSHLGLRYVFRAMRAARGAQKLLVLDCCNAGMVREFGRNIRGRHALSEAEVESSTTCVITATSGDSGFRLAHTRRPEVPSDQYTAFTGYVIDVLRDGLVGGPAVLSATHVVDAVGRRLAEGRHPTPGIMGYTQGSRIKIIHNKERSEESDTRQAHILVVLESLPVEELAAVWAGRSAPEGLEAEDVDKNLPLLIGQLDAEQIATLAHESHSGGDATARYRRWSGLILAGDPHPVGAVVTALRAAECPQCRQLAGQLDGAAMQTFDNERRLRYLWGQRERPGRSARR